MIRQNKLEFEVRLQQYIELVRSGQPEKLLEATRHARKYLSPFKDSESKSIHRAAGLLAFSSSTTAEPYRVRLPTADTTRIDADLSISRCFPPVAGLFSPIYSSPPTTPLSPSPHDHFSTSRSPPVSPHSRLLPVTPPVPQYP